LLVWAGFLSNDLRWLPISRPQEAPPARCMTFCSDAAGISTEGSAFGKPGCGCVGFDAEGKLVFARQFFWPHKFIMSEKNEKGIRFGDNSTVLEVIGLMLPFFSNPSILVGKKVLLKVDNWAVVFGIENRAASNDEITSIFIRAMFLIAAYLECEIFIEYLPRKSDYESLLVDRLSRASSTNDNDRAILSAFCYMDVPDCLTNWFCKPVADWNLAYKLLEFVESTITL
jgi:hypothetical protein